LTRFRRIIVADATVDAAQSQLSVKRPLTSATYGHDETKAFFDNLLLESCLRTELAIPTRHDTRDTTELLGPIGGECAGAVAIWPVGLRPPRVPKCKPIADEQLEGLFVETHGARVTQIQLDARQTMSGVQQKLVLRCVNDAYALPLEGAPTNALIKRTTGRYPGLALNEHICL
jgi:serine/threonine-protein kinase HipA